MLTRLAGRSRAGSNAPGRKGLISEAT